MAIAKESVENILAEYLAKAGINDGNRKKIIDGLNADIEEKKAEQKKAKAKVSHGTSCPRAMVGDTLLFEM